MTTKHSLHVSALIPSHIEPSVVIAALHDHNTCLTLQALTTGHKKLPNTAIETRKDPYWFPPDLHPITTYEVTECVTFMPGVGDWGKRYLTFPSCFQNTNTGLKTHADAPAGVVVRAEFRVVQGGAGDGEVDGEGQGVGYADWVLVEDVEVTCSWWMMPFVRRNMEGAHRDICNKVIEKVEMQLRQEALVKMAAKGKGRVEEDSLRGNWKAHRSRSGSPEDVPDKILYS
jgi:hypothetical protein